MTELLARHTTLRLGGPARTWVEARSEAEVVDAVTAADDAGDPVLVVGGGSNLVVADAGFPGTVVHHSAASVDGLRRRFRSRRPRRGDRRSLVHLPAPN